MDVIRHDAADDQRVKKLIGPGLLGALLLGAALAWVLLEPSAKPEPVVRAAPVSEPLLLVEPLPRSAQPQALQTPSRALEGNDEDWIRTPVGQQAVQASREHQTLVRLHDQQSQERPASFDQHN